MSLRYYVLGSILLVCVFYFSKEMRDAISGLPGLSSLSGLSDPLSSPGSWHPESLTASPRYALPPRKDSESQRVLREKTDLEQWIQSRLTQQGLKEMTEAGHWQSEQSQAL